MDIPEKLIDRLSNAAAVTVLTGAGISAESGVPTFRDAQTGLWERFSPTELASPEAFAQNPRRVWEWYAYRRKLVEGAQPNAGHTALVELEKLVKTFHLVTQNVDRLHQRAGSKNVVELHGNLFSYKCSRDHELVSENTWLGGTVPPNCYRCGAPVRPDIVWFGESLPDKELSEAYAYSRDCDVFLAIGTSGIVHPAATLPYEAMLNGAMVAEINVNETTLSERAQFTVTGKSGDILPELVNRLRHLQQKAGARKSAG